MTGFFKIEGLKEIDSALAALPRATSKAVVRRALKKELAPVADMANGLWPGADDGAFAVSAKLKKGQQGPEAGPNAVNMFVGSTPAAPHAHLLEWGTEPRYHKSGKYVGAVPPDPMLTPSWDAHKGNIIEGLAASIRQEIEATIRRRANRGR
ncbi:hypothetical protein [Phaeobacter sp. JH209A]|uniref:hypothetical protein n=1 Tax=Phaeobacter sp. JH209A TaxID=3112505 RepID=UPI003A8BC946